MARLKRVAIHESGHAIMTIVEGREFREVTIVPSGRTMGAVRDTIVLDGDDETLRIQFGGIVARLCYRGWPPRLLQEAEGDLVNIANFPRSATSCALKTGKTRPHSVSFEIGVITAGRAP